jgi:hypothetical protein
VDVDVDGLGTGLTSMRDSCTDALRSELARASVGSEASLDDSTTQQQQLASKSQRSSNADGKDTVEEAQNDVDTVHSTMRDNVKIDLRMSQSMPEDTARITTEGPVMGLRMSRTMPDERAPCRPVTVTGEVMRLERKLHGVDKSPASSRKLNRRAGGNATMPEATFMAMQIDQHITPKKKAMDPQFGLGVMPAYPGRKSPKRKKTMDPVSSVPPLTLCAQASKSADIVQKSTKKNKIPDPISSMPASMFRVETKKSKKGQARHRMEKQTMAGSCGEMARTPTQGSSDPCLTMTMPATIFRVDEISDASLQSDHSRNRTTTIKAPDPKTFSGQESLPANRCRKSSKRNKTPPPNSSMPPSMFFAEAKIAKPDKMEKKTTARNLDESESAPFEVEVARTPTQGSKQKKTLDPISFESLPTDQPRSRSKKKKTADPISSMPASMFRAEAKMAKMNQPRSATKKTTAASLEVEATRSTRRQGTKLGLGLKKKKD